MSTKSPEEKATERKIKEKLKIAHETARRERAKQVVNGATHIGEFRVMDSDSDTL